MACNSRRPKMDDIRPEQKWDFISLNDFKSTSCFTYFAYGYLWLSLLISTAVYGVDTFTAVNLLAFNRWSGEVQPVVPFNISKWIFAGCIIASWVNLGFEHIRAARVMKRGAVAESYLDSLAVRLQCIRMGKQGRGWRRFLVFAELTKSKKGVEYVALFTYFSFQSWIRIIFCQGPRQVLNALTLYSVFKANLDPTDAKNVGDALTTFFKNIGILASQEHQQAIILSGMVFTLVVWVFGALSLLLAFFFYILFLWHYIPNKDGGLSGYCERKINTRLSRIVSVKVNKAIEEEERKRVKAEAKAAKKGGDKPPAGRQATIPTLFNESNDDKLPKMPMLGRNETTLTLPLYESRPGTPSSVNGGYELNQLDQKRPFPSRMGTNASNQSYASNAPLMGNASAMPYGRAASPAPSIPTLPPLDTYNAPGELQRTRTGMSNASNFSRPGAQPQIPQVFSDRGYTESPVSYGSPQVQIPPHLRSDSMNSDGYGRPVPQGQVPPHLRSDSMTSDGYGRPNPRVAELRTNTPMGPGPAPSVGRRTPYEGGRSSPAPGSEYGRNSPAPFQRPDGRNSPAPFQRPDGRNSPGPGQYQTFNLAGQRAASNASPAPSQRPQQYRNMTDPGQRGPDYAVNPDVPMPSPIRSATGLSGRGTPQSDIARLASPAPYVNNSNGRSPMGPPSNYRR